MLSARILSVLALSAAVEATNNGGCNANNCARAVTGTQKSIPDLETRRDLCSAFLQTTVTPGAVTVVTTVTRLLTSQYTTTVTRTHPHLKRGEQMTPATVTPKTPAFEAAAVPTVVTPAFEAAVVPTVVTPAFEAAAVPTVVTPAFEAAVVPTVVTPAFEAAAVPTVVTPAFEAAAVPTVVTPAFEAAAVPTVVTPAFEEAAVPTVVTPAFEAAAVPTVVTPAFEEAAVPTVVTPAFEAAAVPTVVTPAFEAAAVPTVVTPAFEAAAVPTVVTPAFQEAAVPTVVTPRFQRREAAATKEVPAYATECPDAAAYQSACACWGVETGTVTAPTPTVVETVTVTSTVPTAIATAVCAAASSPCKLSEPNKCCSSTCCKDMRKGGQARCANVFGSCWKGGPHEDEHQAGDVVKAIQVQGEDVQIVME